MGDPNTMRVAEQLEFLGPALPDPPARILDVGCGEGRLAAALQERGHVVVGIDPDPDAVVRATGRGVEAGEMALAQFEDTVGFDAVVFSKSLHHVPELPAALDRVADLLTGAGVVVVDEFAHDEADSATATLFYGLRDLLEAAGLVAPDPEHDHGHGHGHGAASEHDPAAGALERWRAQHQHDPPLHGGDAMLDALRRTFDVRSVERGPYLWSYLSETVEESARGQRATAALLELERQLVDSEAVRPLGLRVVGGAH